MASSGRAPFTAGNDESAKVTLPAGAVHAETNCSSSSPLVGVKQDRLEVDVVSDRNGT